MPETSHYLRTVVAGLAALAVWAALSAAASAQTSKAIVPTDTKATIKLASHVIEHWYDEDNVKLHIFLMIDGFRVEQGGWTLRAQDGVVWLDEGAIGPDGRKTLGVYAEGKVEITGPGIVKPLEMDSVYLTLQTTGDLERPAAGNIEKTAAGQPLYLRGKKVRSEAEEKEAVAAAKAAETNTAEVPSGAGSTTAASSATAAVPGMKTGAAEGRGRAKSKTGRKGGEITVEPLRDIREWKFESKVAGDKRISIWTGGVLLTQGDMEMQAESVVIWTNEGAAKQAYGSAPTAYLEGNVVINQGYRTVRATKVYYDFDRSQALIVDASIRSFSYAERTSTGVERNVSLYYYAERVRQLAEGQFEAENAAYTTSEMGRPHTAISGTEFKVIDLTEPGPDGKNVIRERFEADNVVGSVLGVPMWYWPKLGGDVEDSETALRNIKAGNRTDQGTSVETEWYLWKLLGMTAPKGFRRAFLDLNYYSRRGPYISARGKYERENFYGEFMDSYLHDKGKDQIGGTYYTTQPDRGRVLWRHRQILDEYWQVTAEVSYLSDPNFLRQFYEREQREGKDQETLLAVKRQEDSEALTGLVKGRVNDFQTETDTYPRLEYHRVGDALWGDRLTYFSANVFEEAKYNPTAPSKLPAGDQPSAAPASPTTTIGDTSHELDYPLQVGPAKVVPYAQGRLSYFGDQLRQPGTAGRTYDAGGVQASTYLSKVYNDVHSDFWGLDRLRHINTFSVNMLEANTNVQSARLYPFDEPGSNETKLVDGVDSTDVYQLDWRQRWQTKRGPQQRTVDWIIFDLIMTWYGDNPTSRVSPFDDRVRNNVQANGKMQLDDTTSVVGDVNYVDGGTIHLANLGLAVVRSPRFSYYIGTQYVKNANSSQGTIGCDYVINDKWKFHIFQQYEFKQSGASRGTQFDLTRRLDTWDMTMSFQLDPQEKQKMLFLQFQPVGAPEIKIGN